MYVTIQSQGLQGCILHNLLTAFSVHLAACYLLRLELIWLQRNGKKPEITDALSRGRMLPEANGYADIGFEEAGKHYER